MARFRDLYIRTVLGATLLAGAGITSEGLPAQSAVVLPAKQTWATSHFMPLGSRTESAVGNLSQASFQKAYSFGFGYSTSGDQIRAQVVDTSREGGLSGSVFYAQREYSAADLESDATLGNVARLEQMAGAALAIKINEKVAFSLSGRHQYLRANSSPLSNVAFWTADFGLTAEMAPGWRLMLSAQDLLAEDQGWNYRSFSVGLENRSSEKLRLLGQFDFYKAPQGSVDTGFVTEEAKPSYFFGADYLLRDELALGGSFAALPSWEQNFVELGLDYRFEGFGIEYAFRFSTKSSEAQYHGFAFTADL